MNKTTLLASHAIVLVSSVLQRLMQQPLRGLTFSYRHITAATLVGMSLSVSKLNVAAFAFAIGLAIANVCTRNNLCIESSLHN